MTKYCWQLPLSKIKLRNKTLKTLQIGGIYHKVSPWNNWKQYKYLISPDIRREEDISWFSLNVETATIPSSICGSHRWGMWSLCRYCCLFKIQWITVIYWCLCWIKRCVSFSHASLFKGRYSSSIRAGYGDRLPMVSGRPEEFTSVKICCLDGAGLWSGREAHVQRLRHGREDQVLERAMHCEESGGQQ